MAWMNLKNLTMAGLLTLSAGVFEMQINSGKILAQDIDIFRNPDVDIRTNPNGQSENSSFMGSLTGQWNFSYRNDPKGWVNPITQNGNRLEMLQDFDFSMQKVEGTISGNQIRVNWMGRNGGLVGTISAAGNTIEGELLPLPNSSNRQPTPFIMQRIQAN